MRNITHTTKPFLLATLLTFVLAGCRGSSSITPGTQLPTEANTPTGTIQPPRSLTICMGEEPKSLYLYGGGGLATRTVLETVYDGPIDSLNYSYTPVILKSLPTLDNSGAVLKQMAVKQGDKIFDDNGAAAALVPGVKYRPAGCTDASCVATYSGGSVTMDQLQVTFVLKSGLLWSDGEPLTADDSVYSFELSSSPDTPAPAGMTRAILGTQAYEKLDDLTVRWTALPGNIDPSYSHRFWVPLPRHAWGKMSAAELLTADASTRIPIGWGPYIIQSWTAGTEILLKKNPNYFRAGEGLPHFDTLHIKFIGPDGRLGISTLLSGECDVVDQTVQLDDQIAEIQSLQSQKNLQAAFTTGTAWEYLDFNLKPAAGIGALDYSDVRLREAIAFCLDRQKVVDQTLGGLSAVPDDYVPPQDPLFNKDVAKYPFDTAKGMALLDQIGWRDLDNDPATPRTAQGVTGVANGTKLIVNSTMVSTELRQAAAAVYGTSLLECGIGYVASFTDNSMFVANADGLLFGRLFETVQFGWIAGVEPACELYTTAEIPTIDNGYSGSNPTGFSNPEYDQACDLAHRSLPGTAAYIQNQYQAQKIFAENLPSIPLYLTVKMAVARPDLTGLIMDPTAATDLWNLEAFDIPES